MSTPDGQPPRLPPIAYETKRETGLRHLDGTLSMAAPSQARRRPSSSSAIGDQPELDSRGGRDPDGQGVAAFGRVVSGANVVPALHALASGFSTLESGPRRLGSPRRRGRALLRPIRDNDSSNSFDSSRDTCLPSSRPLSARALPTRLAFERSRGTPSI